MVNGTDGPVNAEHDVVATFTPPWMYLQCDTSWQLLAYPRGTSTSW